MLNKFLNFILGECWKPASSTRLSTNSKLFILLPDELWISIIDEWISTPITVGALDIAFCNELFRKRYLTWLQRFPPSILLSSQKIYFKVVNNDPKQLISIIFLDWFRKRNIYPTSLVYTTMSMNKISVNGECYCTELANDILKNIQTFEVYHFDNNVNAIILNVLNDAPNFKSLKVNGIEASYSKAGLFLACEHAAPYHLLQLDLQHINFSLLSYESWQAFVRSCPMLKDVNLSSCKGIALQHINVLIDHAKHMETISLRNPLDLAVVPYLIDNSNETHHLSSSLSMRSLTMLDYALSDGDEMLEIYSQFKRRLLSKCPLLEILVLGGGVGSHHHQNNALSMQMQSDWCEVIEKSCRHLQSLTVYCRETWLLSVPIGIQQAMGNTCGNTLKHLILFEEIPHELILTICTSLLVLETLQFKASSSLMPAMLPYFQQAPFRHTLRRLKFHNGNGIYVPIDYAELLACFPVLQSISVDLVSRMAGICSSFPTISQIQELNQICRDCSHPRSASISCGVLKLFVNLRKLYLANCILTKEMIHTILTLPHLRSLQLCHIVKPNNNPTNNNNCRSVAAKVGDLFLPQNYPAYGLSPLQEFVCFGSVYDKRFPRIVFNENMIRIFLKRFPMLETLNLCMIAPMTRERLKALQREYRYRTTIKGAVDTIDMMDGSFITLQYNNG